MSDEPQLSEEEAKRFLELRRKLSEDMSTAMKEAMDDSGVFTERFDGSSGELYTVCVRNKYTRFVESVYLDGEGE